MIPVNPFQCDVQHHICYPTIAEEQEEYTTLDPDFVACQRTCLRTSTSSETPHIPRPVPASERHFVAHELMRQLEMLNESELPLQFNKSVDALLGLMDLNLFEKQLKAQPNSELEQEASASLGRLEWYPLIRAAIVRGLPLDLVLAPWLKRLDDLGAGLHEHVQEMAKAPPENLHRLHTLAQEWQLWLRRFVPSLARLLYVLNQLARDVTLTGRPIWFSSSDARLQLHLCLGLFIEEALQTAQSTCASLTSKLGLQPEHLTRFLQHHPGVPPLLQQAFNLCQNLEQDVHLLLTQWEDLRIAAFWTSETAVRRPEAPESPAKLVAITKILERAEQRESWPRLSLMTIAEQV